MGEIETESEALQKMLDDLSASAGSGGEKKDENDDEPQSTDPQLDSGLEHKIIVNCRDEAHQAELLDRFDCEGIDCKAMIV